MWSSLDNSCLAYTRFCEGFLWLQAKINYYNWVSYQHYESYLSANLLSSGATSPSGPGPPHYPGFTITL
jgi:hypothetical protein